MLTETEHLVHPHVRGDDLQPAETVYSFPGSPPRAWGRLRGGAGDSVPARFTPTGLFDEIVYDLDLQQIVDFRLKPWADQFLIVCAAMCEATGTEVPPAGIEPAPSPPEGDALSAELRGRKMASILVGITGGRNPCHWKCRLNLR